LPAHPKILSFEFEPVILVGNEQRPKESPPKDSRNSLIAFFLSLFKVSAEMTKLKASTSMEMLSLLLRNLDPIDLLHMSDRESQMALEEVAFAPKGW
jgi:hypothetical protein